MAYGIQPILSRVHWWELKFGSNQKHADDSQIVEFNARNRKAYTKLLKQVDQQLDTDVKMIKLYDDLYNGSISYPNLGHQYWYLYEFLMSSQPLHGTPQLNNSQWYPANIDPLWSMDSCKMFYMGTVPVPNPDDFPVVFTVLNERLSDFQQDIKASDLSPEQIQQALDWCATILAQKEPFDLFLFYY